MRLSVRCSVKIISYSAGKLFKVEQSTKIGDVFVAQWVATAPFLAEPYKGSDAYITKDGYMQAMVSTFDGGALKMKK